VNGWREDEDKSTSPGCLHTLFQRHIYEALLCWIFCVLIVHHLGVVQDGVIFSERVDRD
jgi:hypothetical protein